MRPEILQQLQQDFYVFVKIIVSAANVLKVISLLMGKSSIKIN